MGAVEGHFLEDLEGPCSKTKAEAWRADSVGHVCSEADFGPQYDAVWDPSDDRLDKSDTELDVLNTYLACDIGAGPDIATLPGWTVALIEIGPSVSPAAPGSKGVARSRLGAEKVPSSGMTSDPTMSEMPAPNLLSISLSLSARGEALRCLGDLGGVPGL